MRRIISFLFIIVIAFTACKKKQENILASIRETRTEIDAKLKDYTYRRVDDMVTEGQGVISGYFRDDEAKKMITERYVKDRRTFTEYYFDDGMLIYVVSQDFIYNKPNTYTEEVARFQNDTEWYDDSKTKLEINKYYFNDNKLIKWTGPSSADVAVNGTDFTEQEPLILARAVLALKHLKEEE